MTEMLAGKTPALHRLRSAISNTTVRGEPIPPAERLIGVDTSKWNSVMNWETCYNAGARFAFFKATQGTTIADVQFPISRQNCTTMPWGCYHFLTTADGTAQANWFLQTVGQNYGVLPPVLDVELASVPASTVRAYVTRLYSVLAEWPMIYTSNYYWGLVVGESDKAWISARCQLWVAHWGTLTPILPTGWTTYAVHQYSADNNGLGVFYGAPPPPAAEYSMDLNYTSMGWLDNYYTPPSWAHEIDAWARSMGYNGVGPDA